MQITKEALNELITDHHHKANVAYLYARHIPLPRKSLTPTGRILYLEEVEHLASLVCEQEIVTEERLEKQWVEYVEKAVLKIPRRVKFFKWRMSLQEREIIDSILLDHVNAGD